MSHREPSRRLSTVRNEFGITVPRPLAIADAPLAMRLAEHLLQRMFSGLPDRAGCAVIDDLFGRISSGCTSEAQLEAEFHDRMTLAGPMKGVSRLLGARARLIANQIRPFVGEGRILDLGCGDALASGMLADKGPVVLADIIDYRDSSQAQREFHLVQEGGDLPFGRHAFDTVLALTVFHHAANPLRLLREAVRVCGRNGRLIVIESVFGVSGRTTLRPLAGKRTELMKQPGLRTYLRLTRQQQLTYCSFIDWFYNRVLHANIALPFQYNTPAGWRRVFRAYGLREAGFFHLGLDQATVPEFHTLHVLDTVA